MIIGNNYIGNEKRIIFDIDKDIKKVEKLKTQLENKGFNLILTKQIGLNKFLLIYKK